MSRMTLARLALTLLASTLLASTLLTSTLLGQSSAPGNQRNLAQLEQQALRAATDAVADSVVQIRTVGGLDRVGKTLLSGGPTTGLILTADGYIVSSAFSFAGQPTSILVRLANGEQLAAELVARDKNRMLVLLKVAAASPLPVPEPVRHDQMRVGQWAVALGRTFQAEQVNVTVGIVSALNRMYGRVIQTDASVSVANYGGPLVDIAGRVLGVLVPMAPQAGGGSAESELAGAEFYDSGIGFAVPLEHIMAVLNRWKQGEDLLAGKLGIGLESGDAHIAPPKIVSVWPSSPAATAGWQPGDLITAVAGQQVQTQAELRFQIIPRYAGDTVSITLRRDAADLQTSVTLAGALPPYRQPFLGILPERRASDDQSEGAVVRGVWPESPADEAGVATGDRITAINETVTNSTADALRVLAGMHAEEAAEVVVDRGDRTLKLSATLATMPTEILSTADLMAATTDRESLPAGDAPQLEIQLEKQLDKQPGKHSEQQLEKLMLPEYSQEAVYLQPPVAAGRRLGLLMWLGDGQADSNQTLVDAWQATCRRDGLLLLIAPPAEAGVWKADDLLYLQQLTQAVSRRLNIDRRRMVISGAGKAGQLAFALALKQRSPFRGVIGIDAPLPRTLKLRPTSPSRRLAVLSVESRDSNFAPLIRRDLQQLRETGYPTSWLQRPGSSDVANELDAATLASMARWIDTMDRY